MLLIPSASWGEEIWFCPITNAEYPDNRVQCQADCSRVGGDCAIKGTFSAPDFPLSPVEGGNTTPQNPQEGGGGGGKVKADYKGEEMGKAFVKFLGWLFSFLLSLAALLALAVIIIAGFKWIAAAGNPSMISDAKDMITKAIIGLILAFASWLILNTINPNLVSGILPGGPGGSGGGDETPGTVWRCESPESAHRNTPYSSQEECLAGCAFKQKGGFISNPISNPICNEVPENEPPIQFKSYICETTQDTGEGNIFNTPEICATRCDGKQSACVEKPEGDTPTWICGTGAGGAKYWTEKQCENWCAEEFVGQCHQ